MNAVGWLWLGFLGIWKAIPDENGRVHDDSNLMLSLLLYAGIALLIFGHKNKVSQPLIFALAGLFMFAAFSRYELQTTDGQASDGVYGILDHPIYTSVGIAAMITALAYGTTQGYLGAGAVVAAMIAKAREEDNGTAY